MKNTKKVFACVLAALMLLCCMPFAVSAAEEIGYTYDAATGKLVITGNGPMQVPDEDDFYPWRNLSTEATSLTISEGITAISEYAFMNFAKLESVEIASTVKTIGEGAFT